MKKWIKAVLTVASIGLLSWMMLSFMGFIKDSYLKQYLVSDEQSGGDGSSQEAVTLRMAWWGGEPRHQATKKAIQIFEEENPSIRVIPEYQGYDGYHDKLMVQISASKAPDLFQFNPENIGTLVIRQQISELGSFVQEGILNISDISESSLLDGKYDGRLYGIPMSIQTCCIVYNQYLFDQAGVAYPKDQWTWQDYEQTIRELKQRLPNGIYPSYDLRGADIVTMMMVHQQGGAYLTKDRQFDFQEQIRLPLSLFQGYAEEGLVPPIEEVSAASADAMLVGEQVAMISSFNAMAQTLQDSAKDGHKYGLAPIPSSAVGERLGSYAKGELLFLVNASSRHQNQAAALLDAFVNNDRMVDAGGLSRGIPVSDRARSRMEQDAQGIEADVFRIQRLAEQSNDIPEPRYIRGWSNFMAVVAEETQQYAFGMKTLDQAIEDMESRFGKLIADSEE